MEKMNKISNSNSNPNQTQAPNPASESFGARCYHLAWDEELGKLDKGSKEILLARLARPTESLHGAEREDPSVTSFIRRVDALAQQLMDQDPNKINKSVDTNGNPSYN
jgi:hypothetical protein